MRIECPHCKASGNMNEKEIPEDGMYLACPRCKQSFNVKPPRKKRTSAFATNTCPSCGYSTFCEEVFDECPHCGIIVKDIIERKRAEEARKREQSPQNMAAAIPPPPPVMPKAPLASKYTRQEQKEEKPKITLASFANGFDPVAAIGWGAVIIAAVFLIMGISGVTDYNGPDIQRQLSEKSVEPVTAWEVFWGYGFLPWLKTVYGLSVLVPAFGFLQRESWGIKAMNVVIIGSMVLGPLYEFSSYVLWIVKSISPPWWAYLVEFLSALLFAAIWAVPLFFLLRYVREGSFKRSYNIIKQ